MSYVQFYFNRNKLNTTRQVDHIAAQGGSLIQAGG